MCVCVCMRARVCVYRMCAHIARADVLAFIYQHAMCVCQRVTGFVARRDGCLQLVPWRPRMAVEVRGGGGQATKTLQRARAGRCGATQALVFGWRRGASCRQCLAGYSWSRRRAPRWAESIVVRRSRGRYGSIRSGAARGKNPASIRVSF